MSKTPDEPGSGIVIEVGSRAVSRGATALVALLWTAFVVYGSLLRFHYVPERCSD